MVERCLDPACSTSQSSTVLGQTATASSLPSGLNATEVTWRGGLKTTFWRPTSAYQIITARKVPDATSFPPGLNATDVTSSECPRRVNFSWHVNPSHILTVPSQLPDASSKLSGRKATEATLAVCPFRVAFSWFVLKSH